MWTNSRAACLIVAAALATSGAWAASAAVHSSNRHSALFASHDVLELELAAPFDDLFANAVRNPDFAVRGRVSYVGPASGRRATLEDVDVSVRGNSSRQFTECPFPKLKLRLPKAGAAEDPVFGGTRKLKIGTHCDDRPDGQLTFNFGRWPNEKSPVREGLVYRLLETADVAVPLTRLARITYVFDGSASRADGGPRKSIVRNALLLEDDDDTMVRLGATGELTVEGPAEGGAKAAAKAAGTFENAQRNFSVLDSARVAFAEAMIGNFDWALRFYAGDWYRDDGKRGLWNVRALTRADLTAFPVIQDFDLAGIVTGRHQWYSGVFPEQFGAARSQPAIEVEAQVQRTRSLFDRPVLDAMRTAFLGRKAAILSAVGDLPVDAGGRANAEAYLRAFFDAIESEEQFYRPVVMRAGVVPWATGDAASASCGRDDHVPVGTPVSGERSGSGARASVQLLDVFWHWAEKCQPVRSGSVWIDADAIGKSYPPR